MTPHLGSVLLRILVVLLTTVLAVALAERAAGILQKRYLARVTVQVRGLSLQDAAPSLGTVADLVTSPEVLASALQALGQSLSAEAIRERQRFVSVRALRHTELVQIGVVSVDPVEAANLANAMAEAFASKRSAEQREVVNQALAALKGEIAALRKSVETLRTETQQMRAESGIIDFWPQTPGETVSLAEALPKLKDQIAAAKALDERVATLTDHELLAEIARATSAESAIDGVMFDLSGRIQQAARDEERLMAKAGDETRLQEVRDRKSRLQQQLSSLVPVLRARIANQAKVLESTLQMTEQAAPPPPEKEALEKYNRAKASYLEEKQRLEELDRKFSTQSMERALRGNPVVIWERAEPPREAEITPYFALALALLLGLVVGIGVAFLARPGAVALVLLGLLLAVAVSFRYPG